MEPIKIIPCLDIKEGRAVKGVQFLNIITDTRDPAEAAKTYCDQEADELVFRDITATVEKRGPCLEWIKQVKAASKVPLTVGGGIRTMDDLEMLFGLGVDKIFINTAAVLQPELIGQAVGEYGKAKVTVAIDGKINTRINGPSQFEVVIKGGNEETGLEIVEWAKIVAELGAGEIILTCKDRDGTRQGYNVEMIRAVAEAVDIPVVAAGGAGSLEHFYQAVVQGKAAALLAASVFLFNVYTPMEVKRYLREKGISVL
jgi:cyclase